MVYEKDDLNSENSFPEFFLPELYNGSLNCVDLSNLT